MSLPLHALLDALFPRGHAVAVEDSVLTGTATTDDGEVTVIGTADKLEVGVDHALALADTVLASTAAHPQRPIVSWSTPQANAWHAATNCSASTAISRTWRRPWTWHADGGRAW